MRSRVVGRRGVERSCLLSVTVGGADFAGRNEAGGIGTSVPSAEGELAGERLADGDGHASTGGPPAVGVSSPALGDGELLSSVSADDPEPADGELSGGVERNASGTCVGVGVAPSDEDGEAQADVEAVGVGDAEGDGDADDQAGEDGDGVGIGGSVDSTDARSCPPTCVDPGERFGPGSAPAADPIPVSRVTRSTTEIASSTRPCGPRARENVDGASGGRAAGIDASRTMPYGTVSLIGPAYAGAQGASERAAYPRTQSTNV